MSVDDWVCADCGNEMHGERGDVCPCTICGSFRVATLKITLELFGENWRDNFKGVHPEIIGIYGDALRKVHMDCVFNGRGRTEKGRFYLISEETAQAVDDALNHWRKEKVNK